MDGAPISASYVFGEFEQTYEKLAKFSKEDNPFAAYIKKQLCTYDHFRNLSSKLRSQLLLANKPLYQATNLNLHYVPEFDQLLSLITMYVLKTNPLKPSDQKIQDIINTDISRSNEHKIMCLLSTHDSILVDMNILQSIYNHYNKKVIFVCAGFVHIFYTAEALEQLGYKKIDTYGSDIQYKSLDDPGYTKPINIAQYFEKNETTSNFHAEKEKKETLVQDLCAVCGKIGAKYRCGNCKQIDYCSQECQRKDWTKHKKVCKKK